MAATRVKYLLQGKTASICFPQLLELRQEYSKLIADNPFPKPPLNPSSIDMIMYLKRKASDNIIKIGPYENITVFEAANRIASDLVLINGIIQIIEDGLEHPEHEITVHLGTKHVKGNGDFLINGKHGEAFNVAESFYKAKLNATLTKWNGEHLSYILVNCDVLGPRENNNSERTRGTRIIGVKNWNII